MSSYALYGSRIESCIPLPEVMPWDGPDIPPGISISVAELPLRLGRPVYQTPLLQIDADGACLLTIETVARYLVQGGTQVVIEPFVDLDSPSLRTFLLGSVLGLLVHQRGLFPLHASAVSIRGKVYAFAGPSGAGKSTLAAMLCSRGHQLVADDICVIDANAPGGPIALPAFPRLKLWRDTLDALDIGTANLPHNREGQDKYHYSSSWPGRFHEEKHRLAEICLLSRGSKEASPATILVTGPQALNAVYENIFRKRISRKMGRAHTLFADAGRIASTVTIRSLVRPFNFEDSGRLVDFIERDIAGL